MNSAIQLCALDSNPARHANAARPSQLAARILGRPNTDGLLARTWRKRNQNSAVASCWARFRRSAHRSLSSDSWVTKPNRSGQDSAYASRIREQRSSFSAASIRSFAA